MTKRDYKRLSIEEFGRHLITTGDLDPVYIALTQTFEGHHDQLCRWLLAYFCYYHCGVACHMSTREGDDFWKEMMIAAKNELPSPLGGRWPRSAERRHARGQQAIKMVADLRSKYGDHPEDFVNRLVTACQGGIDFSEVSKLVRKHVMYGSWISFKVGDILERVLECPINFDNASIFMFKDPREAALMLWRQKMDLPDGARPRDENFVIDEIVGYLKNEFKDLKAPPGLDRPIGLQEIETVLCKWKSHMRGHYPLFNDIDEIREGLDERWGSVTNVMFSCMPEGSK